MPTTSDSSSHAKAFRLLILPLPPKRFLLFLLGMQGALFASAQSLRDAEALSSDGRFGESIDMYEQFITKNPRRTYDHSVAWFGIGYNYLQLGDYEAALRANQRSKTIREQLPVDDVAENYMRSGAIYLQMGDYEQALVNLRQAKSLPVVEPYLFALMEGYMADSYAGLKKFNEAEMHYQLSLESLMVETGEFSPDVVTILYQLAQLYQTQGRQSEAKETLLRALRIEETLPQHDERMGLLLNGMGEVVWTEAGQQAARSYFLRARFALETGAKNCHTLLARIALNLSKAALADGDRGQAAAEALEAQRMLFPGFSSVDFLQNPTPDQPCLDRILAAESFLQKAHCLTDMTGPPSQYAGRLFSESLRLLELESLAFPSADRRLRTQNLLIHLADEAISAAFKTDSSALQRQAFEWAERAKAVLLHVRTAVPMFLPGSPSASLLRQCRQLEYQYIKAPEDVVLAKRIAEVQAAYFESLANKTDGGDREVPLLHQAFSTNAIQVGLDDATAMLSYYIGAQQYYIFALSRNDFKALALPFNHKHLSEGPENAQPSGGLSKPNPTLQHAVGSMLEAIQNAQSDDFAFYASDLYGKLIQPVQHIISGKKNLVIIPHNFLAGIPFEALLTSAVNDVTKKPPHKWPYLVKQYTVQYGLTANMWAVPPSTAGGTWAYVAWAPVFDTPETKATLANAMHQVLPHSTQLSAYGTLKLPQLPESESEVQAAAQAWNKQPGGVRLHLRRDATEASVRDMAGKAKIAHFATQGFSHAVHPRWSGLVLTPSGDDDGILYLSEIQLQTWTGTLCVLSGISNPNSPPDCVLYPAYAFMRAGAGGVVSTLWAGQDQARIRLLTDFFSKKSGGLSISESLRQSKLALIKDKTTAEPHKWSGIIYFGK